MYYNNNNNNEKQIINNKIKNLKKEIIKIEKNILNSNINYKNIINLEKNILNLELNINELIIEKNLNLTEEKKKIKEIKISLELINKYKSYIIDSEMNTSINLLTFINLIFFPLSLIVGYYGMNFESMGCPSTKNGIFSIKYGQTWVLFLFIILTTIVFIITYIKLPIVKKIIFNLLY